MTADNPLRTQAIGEQEIAADPRASVFVSANAGSGKTHVLVNRVIRLLLAGAKPEQILCVTFTKAAASEMLSRLFARLGEFSVLPLDELQAELGKLQRGWKYGEDDLLRARRLFAQALETPGGLKIRTIHSFCESLIRQFPLEAGVSPAFRLVEGRELEELQQRVQDEMGEAIVAGSEPELADALDVLVGHGAGNLDTVVKFTNGHVRELADLVSQAGGLDAAIFESTQALGVDVTETREETCQAFLRDFFDGPAAELVPMLQASSATNQARAKAILDARKETDPVLAWQILQAAFFTKAGKPSSFSVAQNVRDQFPDVEHVYGQLQDMAIAHQMHDRAIQCLALTRAGLTIAGEMARRLTKKRTERGWLVFDDLIDKVQRLLGENLSRDWVLYKLDNRLAHVLVDEAQDNSPAQWKLLKDLVEEFISGKGSEFHEMPRTLFAVGDPKQSIYGFQGAKPALFEDTREEYRARLEETARPLETPQLALSWRSTPQVLGFVDACFDKHAGQAPETKFLGEAPEHEPQSSAGPGFVHYMRHGAERQGQAGSVIVYPPFAYQETEADKDPSAPVNRMAATDAKARLAHEVAQNVKDMVAQGMMVHARVDGKWQKRAVQYGDILILVRARKDLFRELIRQLKLLQIPIAGADRIKLLAETAVQDLLSLADFCLQPGDDLALAEVLRSPFLHPVGQKQAVIDEDALMHLAMDRDDKSLWSALRRSDAAHLLEAKKWLSDLISRAGQETPYGFFAGLLNRPFANGDTPLQRIFGRLSEEAADGVQEFLSRALSASRDPDNSLTGFVTDMASREDGEDIKRELEGAGNVVRVMTVHGAKGLEAPVVILPETNDAPGGQFRSGLQQDDSGVWLWMGNKDHDVPAQLRIREHQALLDAQESQRLLYVALTRAQDHLRIFCAERGSRKEPVREDGWYAKCQNAMAQLAGGGSADVFHDLNWHKETPGYRLGEVEVMSAPAELKTGQQPVGLPEWATMPLPEEMEAQVRTPSSLTDTAEARAVSVSPLRDDAKRRFLRGNLIHALLESLPQQPEEQWHAAAEHYLVRQPDLDDVQRADILQAVFGVLENPEFADLFGPMSRAELPVVGLGAHGAMVGQIDRLVVREDEVLVVDFKSNRPPAKDVSQVPDSYQAQMRAYAGLLQQIWPEKRIRTALLWTDGPHLMWLPE